jgi:peptidyl-tRNA hydrolase
MLETLNLSCYRVTSLFVSKLIWRASSGMFKSILFTFKIIDIQMERPHISPVRKQCLIKTAAGILSRGCRLFHTRAFLNQSGNCCTLIDSVEDLPRLLAVTDDVDLRHNVLRLFSQRLH